MPARLRGRSANREDCMPELARCGRVPQGLGRSGCPDAGCRDVDVRDAGMLRNTTAPKLASTSGATDSADRAGTANG